eukprot:10686102-Alexandrium_andersonii.AAC.1
MDSRLGLTRTRARFEVSAVATAFFLLAAPWKATQAWQESALRKRLIFYVRSVSLLQSNKSSMRPCGFQDRKLVRGFTLV